MVIVVKNQLDPFSCYRNLVCWGSWSCDGHSQGWFIQV